MNSPNPGSRRAWPDVTHATNPQAGAARRGPGTGRRCTGVRAPAQHPVLSKHGAASHARPGRPAGSFSGMARITDPPWAADAVWQEHKTALDQWPAGLAVLELCAGAGTAGIALQLLLGPGKWETAGAYDMDPELNSVHALLHGQTAAAQRVHCGASGDILTIDVDRFPPAHIIVAGPPCPPYSSIGKRAGLADERARPFVRCIDIICQQASRQGPRPLLFLC
jgi:hypothetical protein